VKVAVSLDATYVTTPATGVVPGPVKVKVVSVIVAGFIATLKVAVTGALGHTPVAAARGATGLTIGVANSGLAPELQQPVLKMSSRNAINPILELLYLRMTFILFLRGSPLPRMRIPSPAI
jgi:hypothetical protein